MSETIVWQRSVQKLDDKRIKQRIEELVGRYNSLKGSKSLKELESLSEANVRADFVDPLFDILGWNIKDPDKYDPRKLCAKGRIC